MSDSTRPLEPSYIQKADAAIRDLLLEFECQPILFVGSGMPRRYFGAPNWQELLKEIFMLLPNGGDRFEYFRQKLDADPIAIGSALSDLVFEWAWDSGRYQFPESFFGNSVRKETFVKYLACRYLEEQVPEVPDVDEK